MVEHEQNIIENKNKTIKNKKRKLYFFWKDKQFIWTILSFLAVFFLVISFLNIKGLTTIYSYSLGLFFGMFSPIFIILFIFLSIKFIFKMKKTYSFGVFHFSLLRLFFVILSLIILGVAIYYTKYKPEDYTASNAFINIFKKWYQDFKGNGDVWLPYKWQPGIIFSFIYFLISFIGGKIGIVLSFLFAIILFIISLVFFFISDTKIQRIFKYKKKKNNLLQAKNKNININLDKKDIFEYDKTSKETINIDSSLSYETKEIYLNNFKDEEELKKEESKEILILPDEPDFSTQEIENAYLEQNQDFEIENNDLKDNNETNIEFNNEFIESKENLNNEKEIYSYNSVYNLLKEENKISLDNENLNKKNDKKDNSDSSKFSLIDDKEDLF
ncbi:hypothetical protein MCAN360_0096 [Metamycoplasma canadense]|uniref:Cell division protein FtsK n=2 Tax=Metamycoplasma canadense TaxID=29554 RepID=A0A077L8K6_9BACT|nr:hypothetical protein MCAN360_0096 [Metamycoplasma canadense]